MSSPVEALARLAPFRVDDEEFNPWYSFYLHTSGPATGSVHEGVPYLPFATPVSRQGALIRNCYFTVYESLLPRLEKLERELASPAEQAQPVALRGPLAEHVVLYGSPGIGKSTALAYILARARAEMRPCVFHTVGQKDAWVFLDQGCFHVEIEALETIHMKRPAILALDSPGAVPPPPPHEVLHHLHNCLIVLATSPLLARHQPFQRASLSIYYWTIPPVGLEEIQNFLAVRDAITNNTVEQSEPVLLAHLRPGSSIAGVSVNAGSPDTIAPENQSAVGQTAPSSAAHLPAAASSAEQAGLSGGSTGFAGTLSSGARQGADEPVVEAAPEATEQYTPLERYELLGPSFRLALQNSRPRREGHDKLLGLDPKTALGRVQQFSRFLAGHATSADVQSCGLHRLFYLVPDPACEQPAAAWPAALLVCPTPFLWDFVRRALAEQHHGNALAMAHLLIDKPYLFGLAYHYAALPALCRFPSVHMIRFPDSAGFSIPVPHPLPLRKFNPSSGSMVPHEDGVYVLPPDYSSFNGFAVLGSGSILALLQVSVAPAQSVSHSAIAELLSLVTEPFDRYIFAFVGPQLDQVIELAKVDRDSLGGFSTASTRTSKESEQQGVAALQTVAFEQGYIHLPLATVKKSVKTTMVRFVFGCMMK
ncbi:hypothetical protein Rhopal_000857-T1 [Rhodotorula paludigena]|uniref:AAA+ ATPase domain-containing protein n=1 Tax=Rhodotorula paludigena TaxID=86838 RepID=A0AAV5GEY0_9BASI|nr:hypothetical protein Rhopal_000857-T1 [Rhodotorula paludigena]